MIWNDGMYTRTRYGIHKSFDVKLNGNAPGWPDIQLRYSAKIKVGLKTINLRKEDLLKAPSYNLVDVLDLEDVVKYEYENIMDEKITKIRSITDIDNIRAIGKILFQNQFEVTNIRVLTKEQFESGATIIG